MNKIMFFSFPHVGLKVPDVLSAHRNILLNGEEDKAFWDVLRTVDRVAVATRDWLNEQETIP